MLVEDLLGQAGPVSTRDLNKIHSECADFLQASGGEPLYRSLPETYNGFHKVKVRQKSKTNIVYETFDIAFEDTFAKLTKRAIFAYPTPQELDEGFDHYYVFPINGFKYLYSKEVTNSSKDYKQLIDVLFENLDNEAPFEIVTELLKYTYTRENLIEGLKSNSEIILYGVPYYYAVRASLYEDYTKLIS